MWCGSRLLAETAAPPSGAWASAAAAASAPLPLLLLPPAAPGSGGLGPAAVVQLPPGSCAIAWLLAARAMALVTATRLSARARGGLLSGLY
jgi:hypothetical protein